MGCGPSNSALRLAVFSLSVATLLFAQSYLEYITLTSKSYEIRSKLIIQSGGEQLRDGPETDSSTGSQIFLSLLLGDARGSVAELETTKVSSIDRINPPKESFNVNSIPELGENNLKPSGELSSTRAREETRDWSELPEQDEFERDLYKQVSIVDQEKLERGRQPLQNLDSVDFSRFSSVFEFVARNESYAPKEITASNLTNVGLSPWLHYYRVKSTVVPVYSSVQRFVDIPANNESPETFIRRLPAVKRVIQRGAYIMGVDTMVGKHRNSLWAKIGPREFVPVFNRVLGKKYVVVHLELESKIPALSELNSKPFERKSRECRMVRENQVRNACYKFANAMHETRRLLREFGLLRVGYTNSSLPYDESSSTSFNEQMLKLFRPMSEIEICLGSEWTQCTLHPFCTWTYSTERESNFCTHVADQPAFPQQGVFPAHLDAYNKSLDFVNNPNDGKHYFVYQPSGGINNQRIQLEMALTICLITNRTCVLPHMAQHTNYYFRYNLHPASRLISVQRVFDMRAMLEVVDVVTLPEHLSLMQWIESVGGLPFVSTATGLSANVSLTNGWRVVQRDSRKMISKYIWKDVHMRRFATDPARFVFFANNTMWKTIALNPWSLKSKQVRNAVTFAEPTKRLAIALSDRLGLYNALHVRRGDKKKEPGFLAVVRDAEVYGERMLPFSVENPLAQNHTANNTLYLATDEKDKHYFDPIREMGFSVIDWHHLDQASLMNYLSRFPPQMFRDVLGMIEQLICAYSNKFLGSSYSTFSTFILRMRRLYPAVTVLHVPVSEAAVHDSHAQAVNASTITLQPRQWQNISLSSYSSKCDPFRPEAHRLPC